MKKRPMIIEEKMSIKERKYLRYIVDIELLRKKIGCESYDDLRKFGYNVDAYFARKSKEHK